MFRHVSLVLICKKRRETPILCANVLRKRREWVRTLGPSQKPDRVLHACIRLGIWERDDDFSPASLLFFKRLKNDKGVGVLDAIIPSACRVEKGPVLISVNVICVPSESVEFPETLGIRS